MTFLVNDYHSGEQFEFEDETAAQAKAEEIADAAIAREDYRFTVAKEVVDGNNTTWTNADLTSDLEDGTYFVFNTYTGAHEKTTSLSAAIARRNEIRAEFKNSLYAAPIFVVPVQEQPKSQGVQDL